MIARRWRVWATPEQADDLEPYLQRTGIQDALRTPGSRGAVLLREVRNDQTEFTLLTFWDDWDAIVAFAGEDIDHAVLFPEDDAGFTSCDERVEHVHAAVWGTA